MLDILDEENKDSSLEEALIMFCKYRDSKDCNEVSLDSLKENIMSKKFTYKGEDAEIISFGTRNTRVVVFMEDETGWSWSETVYIEKLIEDLQKNV